MTYGQGVQVGLIVAAFTGLVSGVASYVAARFVDPSFTKRVVEGGKIALQKSHLDEGRVQEVVRFMEANITPEFLLVITPLTTLLIGLVFTLVITVFSKRSKE